jgi:DNA mismatch endonuclease (patch repair protein)
VSYALDIVSPARRSEIMSRIRGKETKPEIAIRKVAHRLGYRFRLHRRDLPGSPDLVFPGRKVALFSHGCFWHRHPGCRFAYDPKSNVEFWQAKFKNNVSRDACVEEKLKRMDWRVAIIWECETSDLDSLSLKLMDILGDRGC